MIKKILFLAAFLIASIGSSAYAQRDWEGGTLEFEAADYSPESREGKSMHSKFWMTFKHGVVRISNSNNDYRNKREDRFMHYYFVGGYDVAGDTLTVDIYDRKVIIYDFRAGVLDPEKAGMVPPEGEIAEQYKFIIQSEGKSRLELLPLHSFFIVKKKGNTLPDETKLPIVFSYTENEYDWLTLEEYNRHIPKGCGFSKEPPNEYE